MRSGHDVEEGRSLANEFEGAGWFGIEVSVKVLLEDMDEVELWLLAHCDSALGGSSSSDGRTVQWPFGWLDLFVGDLREADPVHQLFPEQDDE